MNFEELERQLEEIGYRLELTQKSSLGAKIHFQKRYVLINPYGNLSATRAFIKYWLGIF